MIYTCTLPFPPSVNGLYGGGSGQGRFKSKGYKKWLALCPPLILPSCGSIDYEVTVRYVYYLPDNRKRDLTNYVKAPEDYIVEQGVLFDDNHTIVTEARIEYGGIDRDNPRVVIEIT